MKKYTEWYKSYLAHEQEMRERGGPQRASFAPKPPTPRQAPPPPPPPPSVQAQLAALSVAIYAARKSAANRDEAEMRMAQATLAQPFKMSCDAIYKRRAAEVRAHRMAASQGMPQQAAPAMPSAEEIYLRRQREAKGAA